MSVELPYRRRRNERSAAQVVLSIEQSPAQRPKYWLIGKIWDGFALLVKAIWSLLFVLLSPVFIAVLAAFFGVYFTLTTLESFKAEEALRQFAIADMYKPMREASEECIQKREKHLNSGYIYVGITKTLHGYLSEAMKNPASMEISSDAALAAVKPLAEEYGKAFQGVVDGVRELPNCEARVNNMALELATVLGMSKEYVEQRKIQLQKRPSAIPAVREGDIAADILLNPVRSMALFRAFKDGSEGSLTRKVAAFSSVKFGLGKSVEHGEKYLANEETLLEHVYSETAERNGLFLANLTQRFKLTPKSTLDQLIIDLKDQYEAIQQRWEAGRRP